MALKVGGRVFSDDQTLIMAIVNRTPDSFYDQGATWEDKAALARVEQVVADGADIIDIGGVKAGYGPVVDTNEEIRRVVPFVERVRKEFPDLPISVDTWRSEVGRAVCDVGADLLNDAWGAADPELAAVAAEYDVGLVCSHTGGVPPRGRPHRLDYDDVVADAIEFAAATAERAVSLGVDRERLMIDPTHDFGKTTFQSLEMTRRTGEFVATGWPVLMALSNKNFVGETLGLPTAERLMGTLAATAIAAFAGARIFRAHQVTETRQVIDMANSIAGRRPPAFAVRGLP